MKKIITLVVTIYSLESFALTQLTIQGKSQTTPPPPQHNLIIHPMQNNLNLLDHMGNSPRAILEQLLSTNPIQIIETKPDKLHLIGGSPIEEFTFRYHETPICNTQVKATYTKDKSYLFMLGNIPEGITPEEDPPLFPSVQNAFDLTKNSLIAQNEINRESQIHLQQHTACYWYQNHELIPAQNLKFKVNGIIWIAYANATEIFDFYPLAFHVTGKAKIYTDNPKTGEIETSDIEVLGDGTLTNQFFASYPQGTETIATSAENTFFYEPDTIEFEQTSVYAHANQMLDYFLGLGYTWQGPKPLRLKTNFAGGNLNNAFYVPGEISDSTSPEIIIGDSDGKILTNLAVDADVIYHELGHHIIFKNITNTRNESLRLHEGLADFFTFAKTKNGCLGESICPENSTACVIKAQCLRAATDDLTFASTEYYRSEAHVQGQVVSGMLWDLKESGAIELGLLAQITFNSLDLLVSNSGYFHFIMALLYTDLDLANGEHACQIYDAAVARGFTSFLNGISCDNSGTWVKPAAGVIENPPTVEDDSESSSSKGGICGTLGGTTNTRLSLLLMLLAPLLVAIVGQRLRSRIRK